MEDIVLNAEKIIIGCALINNDKMADVISNLDETDFYYDIHKKIYSAMVKLYKTNNPIEEFLIISELPENIKGSYLVECRNVAVVPDRIKSFIEIVKNNSLKRKIVTICQKAIKNSEGIFSDEVKNFIGEIEKEIYELSKEKSKSNIFHIKDIIPDVLKRIEDLNTKKITCSGISTGYKKLDYLICGLEPGVMTIIAARTTVGKTSFALNLAINILKQKKIVLFFSIEMMRLELATRLLSTLSEITIYKLKNGYINKESEWNKFTEIGKNLYDTKFYIDDSSTINTLEIRARTMQYKPDVIIIDYLQKIKPMIRGESRNYEIGEITGELKAIAKDMNIPVILLSQLNRGSELRKGKEKRPVLADLRDSGNIEQDADIVIMLYRPNMADEIEQGNRISETEVIIEKNRNGAQGLVKMEFLTNITSFREIETTKEEEKKVLSEISGGQSQEERQEDNKIKTAFDKIEENRADLNG